MKTKAFSVSIGQCREDHYRGSGAGGQNRNKRDTGIRLTHEPSGAVAECEQERSQRQNRVGALTKLAKHPKFIAWARMQVAGLGKATEIRESDLRVEIGEAAAECRPREDHCDVKES